MSTTTNMNNPLRWSSSLSLSEQAKSAHSFGVNKFSIFIKADSPHTGFPKQCPVKVKKEILGRIKDPSLISTVHFTKDNRVILETNDIFCAQEILGFTEFLSIPATPTLISDNIITKFLIRDIPLDILLYDLVQEIESENNLRVFEVRRFTKKINGIQSPSSSILVSVFGSSIPDRIKLWYTRQPIKIFIDNPRQCGLCFKFNHSSSRCKSEALCSSCGKPIHPGPCSTKMICVNCSLDHDSSDKSCPSRLEEMKFLRYKCLNRLSFAEARRTFKNTRAADSYARITQPSVTADKFLSKEEFHSTMSTVISTFQASLESALQTQLQFFNSMLQEFGKAMSTSMSELVTSLVTSQGLKQKDKSRVSLLKKLKPSPVKDIVDEDTSNQVTDISGILESSPPAFKNNIGIYNSSGTDLSVPTGPDKMNIDS